MSGTETVDPRFVDLDIWSSEAAIGAMLDGQAEAVAAIRREVPAMARAVDAAALLLTKGGRLVYAGAGTSGRLAVLDGTELGPTFGWPQERLVYLLAGGMAALSQSVEGAEDDVEAARRQVAEARIGAGDVVIGVAASGKTPFTFAVLKAAREAGALTIGLANNAGAPLLGAAEHGLCVETGSEVIAGSTRMKAGTAQKAVLNLLSSTIMLRLGHVYRGRMVDMVVSNAKLEARAQSMVAELAGCGAAAAAEALALTGNRIKLATLIALGLEQAEAEALLARHGRNLRAAMDDIR